MHRAPRRLLLIGLIGTTVVLAAATFMVLRPPGRADSAIATVSALGAAPTFLVLKDHAGLETLAQSRREESGVPVMGRAARGPDLPVWILRVGGEVRAFIAYDSRNGCSLDLVQPGRSGDIGSAPRGALLHDTCHGSFYDDRGRPVGGPSPFYLDQLVLTVKGEAVFASTTDVVVGQFVLPQR